MQRLFEGGAYLSKYVVLIEILLDNAANYFMFFLSEPSSETKTPLSHQYSSNIESSSRWVGKEIFHIIVVQFNSWLPVMMVNVCMKAYMDWELVTL